MRSKLTVGYSTRIAASALVVLFAASPLAAQTSVRGNPESIVALTSAGCSGISWSRTNTPTGAGFPEITEADGPANQGGLKAGDIVLEVDGIDVRSMDTWFNATPGARVTLTIKRGEKEMKLEVIAGRVIDLGPEKREIKCVSPR